MEPQLSVCIPVYNGAAFIREAVDSALAQEVGHLEVVVCNNRSTDGTLAALEGITDARLRILSPDEHVGMAANWNRAAALASGELVLMLSADDCLLPGALLALAAPFLDDAPPDLVMGRPVHLDEAQDRPFGVAIQPMPSGRVSELESFVVDHTPSINVNATLFRRGLVRFRENAGLVCDLDLFLALGRQGKAAEVIEREVLAYREHEGALSTDRIRMWRETIAVYLHRMPGSRCDSAYRRRLFKTLFWFATYLSSQGDSHAIKEPLDSCRGVLSAWRRALLLVASRSGFALPALLWVRRKVAR